MVKEDENIIKREIKRAVMRYFKMKFLYKRFDQIYPNILISELHLHFYDSGEAFYFLDIIHLE